MASTDATIGEASAGRLNRPAVILDACWKAFGRHVALQPCHLWLAKGSVSLVSGANGAGKSTLLRLAAGSLRPSGGHCWLAGTGLYLAAGDGGRAVQTVGEAVGHVAALASGDAGHALAQAGCTGFADRKVAELSRGQRTRLTLAVAVAAAPAVLCLDEPAAHLDHAGQETLWHVVDALRAGGSAVMVATPGDAAAASAAPTDARLHVTDGRLEASA